MVRRFNRVLLFFVSSALLLAQSETATLRGTITDTAGKGVVGVQLVIFESGKELSVREINTTKGGIYEAAFLRPGTYIIKIDANHYQTFEADGIVLKAGQERNYDAQLKPEARDETVQLDEASSPVLSQSGMVSGRVDFKQAWQDAPFMDLHPSVLPLLTQAPAVQGNGQGSQAGLTIGGVTSRNQQTWAIDGVAQDTTIVSGIPAFAETIAVAIAGPGVESAKPVRVDLVPPMAATPSTACSYYKRGSSGSTPSLTSTPQNPPTSSPRRRGIRRRHHPPLDLFLRRRHVPEESQQPDPLRRCPHGANAHARS